MRPKICLERLGYFVVLMPPKEPGRKGGDIVIRPADSTLPVTASGELPEGVATLPQVLAELSAILLLVRDTLNRQADERLRVEPLALRLDELADAVGVSRRALERERAAGRLPKPDLHIGKMPLWRVETIRAWLERGGRR